MPMSARIVRITSLIALLFVLAQTADAQPKQNSPYSRYGLGDFQPQYFAHQAGMAGLAVGFHDPQHLNVINPASFAFLNTATYETGLYANYSHFESDQGSLNNWSGNLSYLALGFTLKSPINEALDKVQSPWKLGMGFSVTPYTLVGYNVEAVDTLPDLGRVSNQFQGDGGTYKFNWSNAVRYKRTAIGLNLGWFFGRTSFNNSTVFTDSLPTFQNNFRTDVRANGFIWKLGVQHDWVLAYSENNLTQPTRWVTFGLTANSNHRVRLRSDQLLQRSRGLFANNVFIGPDTLLFEEGAFQSLTLPAGIGLGVMLVELNRYRFGLDYAFENWSAYENEVNPETLRNTHAISIGGEYTPDYASYNNYLKKVRLRAGAYYRQDPRVINGTQLNDIGVSVGFGFPVVLPRLQTSFVNTALEVGSFGADTPIRETYFRFTVGFCLNDNTWFYKRRFE